MKSMTGYGASEGRVGKGVLFAEIRGVNSRFLDINCKLPPRMYVLEPKIKKFLQNKIVRGKLDVFLKEKTELAESLELRVNETLVKQYKRCLNEISGMLGMKASSHLLEVVDLKELVSFRDKPLNVESLWKQIERVLSLALGKFDSMRKKEGQALKIDQTKRIANLARLTASVSKLSEIRLKSEHKKVRERIDVMNGATDENRVNCELASLSDKLDITEEITRLKSHISQYRHLIKKEGSVGRQIDFLIQEMHREINTLGSKACNSEISNLVVEAKAELEKLREQVQNIE